MIAARRTLDQKPDGPLQTETKHACCKEQARKEHRQLHLHIRLKVGSRVLQQLHCTPPCWVHEVLQAFHRHVDEHGVDVKGCALDPACPLERASQNWGTLYDMKWINTRQESLGSARDPGAGEIGRETGPICGTCRDASI